MKRKLIYALLGWLTMAGLASALAQGTAFLYQGRLNDGGSPAAGVYDLRFGLYDAVTTGNVISSPQTNLAVVVNSGLFLQVLDFGQVFTGSNYWLSIGVRTNGSTNAFAALWPRQALLPVPYAEFAGSANNLLGRITTAQISGTLTATQLAGTYSGQIAFTNANNLFSGIFTGNGGALTNLNAGSVATGTLPDARLSANVPLLNGNQTFSGANSFTGPGNYSGANSFTNWNNSFTGSFFGNGLVGWVSVAGNSVQAARDTGYMLTSSSLTTLTLPATASLQPGDIIRISGAGSGGWRIAQNAGQSIYGNFLAVSNYSSWFQANAASAGWQCIVCSADGNKMSAAASANAPGTYYSADAGKTWNNSSGTAYTPISMASSADGTKLAGAIYGGAIIVSINSGATWSLSGAGNYNWSSIASSADGTKLVGAVYNGQIYSSVNSGATWAVLGNSPSLAWYSVASSSDGAKLAAVVNNGPIYVSANSGGNWTAQATTAYWTAITSSSDGSKLAATANAGKIWTSTDSGATWIQQTNAPTAAWSAIASSADGGQLVAAVNGGGIYFSANFGATWIKQPLADQNWKDVTCSADGTKMAAVYNPAGNAGGIYFWQTSAQSAATTVGPNGSLCGGQGSAVELQYIGNGMFMPISLAGALWAN